MTIWQRHKALMAIMTIAMLLGTMAHAAVLTFDGAICNGGNPCSQRSNHIDQTYGDIPGQLDVIYTDRFASGNGPINANFLSWWDTRYSGLVNIAWGGVNDGQGVGEIALIPAPGFQVTLNSFDLGSYPNFSRSSQYTIYDSTYTPLVSSGAITIDGSAPAHFSFNLANAQGLIIQWGPSAFNVGIDNVDFTVEPIAGPERTTGNLQLEHTKITTVTASTPPAVITLPTCPTRVAVFNSTAFTCPATATVCTVEATVTSEVSDVTPGADSIRFYFTVDGAAAGVFPTTNFGVHSTAKTGQIEAATASWMHHAVPPGNHTLAVRACVADTTGGGGATAFAGDRILMMRLYMGN